VAGDLWLVIVAVLPVLALVVLVVVVRGRDVPEETEALVAEPEDRPVPAVVVNPTKAEPGTREEIIAVCTGLGWAEPLWLETTVDDPGTGQAAEAVERGADVVLACGGDGTVRAVAEALVGTGVAMGLVPAGTGNLLARTIGTPLQDIGAAARVALSGDDRKIDVGRIRVDGADDEHVFLVMAGTGFDAAIMANTPEALKVRVGPLAYVISGLRAIRGRRTRVRLTFDDQPPRRRGQQRHPARRAGAHAPRHHRRRGARRRQHRAQGRGRVGRGGRAGDDAAGARARARGALAGQAHRGALGLAAAVPDRRRPGRRRDGAGDPRRAGVAGGAGAGAAGPRRARPGLSRGARA
jgi:hypothetical protein